MKRRQTVFDSLSERRAFTALRGRWSDTVDVYPQLPLAKVVDLDAADEEGWPAADLRYFRATNVDYTLCEKGSGVPLLSIEFDGIGGGFSRAGRYVARRPTRDRRRKWKMDFKLRVAEAVGYPLLVVSFDETEALTEDEELTVLDGMVGAFLARRAFPGIVDELVGESELEEFDGWERDELAADLVLQAEVLAKVDHDLLARDGMEAMHLASRAGAKSWSVEYLTDPPVPESRVFPPPLEVIAAAARAVDSAERLGCRIRVETPVGTVERTSWVRNVGVPWFEPSTVAENITRLLVFRSALALATGEEAPLVG